MLDWPCGQAVYLKPGTIIKCSIKTQQLCVDTVILLSLGKLPTVPLYKASYLVFCPQLSTGRVEPRVGSGNDLQARRQWVCWSQQIDCDFFFEFLHVLLWQSFRHPTPLVNFTLYVVITLKIYFSWELKFPECGTDTKCSNQIFDRRTGNRQA